METLAASGRTAVEGKAEVREAEILLILPHRHVSAIRRHLHLRSIKLVYVDLRHVLGYNFQFRLLKASMPHVN